MGTFARLLIALFVILSQTGLARAYAACPVADAVKASAACPMSGLKGCNCCGDKKDGPAEKKGSCFLKDAKQQEAKATLASEMPAIPALILPEPPVLAVPRLVEPEVRKVHLVVPRIRTPDIGGHPLRAPPTR